jgi:hypothetical protein
MDSGVGAYFMTLEALEACGDWIDGTRIRFHYGARHMIVVSARLSFEIIEQALRQIDNAGEIELCTLPLD